MRGKPVKNATLPWKGRDEAKLVAGSPWLPPNRSKGLEGELFRTIQRLQREGDRHASWSIGVYAVPTMNGPVFRRVTVEPYSGAFIQGWGRVLWLFVLIGDELHNLEAA
jgi:hypothetical protein